MNEDDFIEALEPLGVSQAEDYGNSALGGMVVGDKTRLGGISEGLHGVNEPSAQLSSSGASCIVNEVKIVTQGEASGISWDILDSTLLSVCSNEALATYSSHSSYEEPCCLAAGEYTLVCKSLSGKGWLGGNLHLDGTGYCSNSELWSRHSVEFTLVQPAQLLSLPWEPFLLSMPPVTRAVAEDARAEFDDLPTALSQAADAYAQSNSGGSPVEPHQLTEVVRPAPFIQSKLTDDALVPLGNEAEVLQQGGDERGEGSDGAVDALDDRRLSELSVTVSTVAELTSALADSTNAEVLLAEGTYQLDTQLNIARNVTIRALVEGTAVLAGRGINRVLYISSGATVELSGLNVTGGYEVSIPRVPCCHLQHRCHARSTRPNWPLSEATSRRLPAEGRRTERESDSYCPPYTHMAQLQPAPSFSPATPLIHAWITCPHWCGAVSPCSM